MHSLGIPKQQVEPLTRVKSETIRCYLKQVFERGCGDELALLVEGSFAAGTIHSVQVSNLLELFEVGIVRTASGLFRGKLKRLSASEREELLAKATQILGFSVKVDEDVLTA